MKTEKDNQIWYQNTFNEVHASEHLFRKVEAMRNENGTFKRTLSKGAIAAAAFAALIFSNVISYAASGSAWILTVTLPGGEILQYEVDSSIKDEVKVTAERNASDPFDPSDPSVQFESMDSSDAEVTLDISNEDDASRLAEENGRIYLVLDGEHRVDITDDFKNGSCKGTCDADGVTWCYEVSRTLENPDILVYVVTCNVSVP